MSVQMKAGGLPRRSIPKWIDLELWLSDDAQPSSIPTVIRPWDEYIDWTRLCWERDWHDCSVCLDVKLARALRNSGGRSSRQKYKLVVPRISATNRAMTSSSLQHQPRIWLQPWVFGNSSMQEHGGFGVLWQNLRRCQGGNVAGKCCIRKQSTFVWP
ncbi:hypothetical protein BDU57DRAFT_104945 [Ampelomyces quisqualis]|uniref:Uncharacterized protein n=1 Tax=Ampelomyces quisqualis TaxID=50730 RepID=A0A6A5Q7G9_AMPQU|nr:hypothetical protein BDU57DRAFT_104945 [Ampelomyces quisqualis]